jgi:predicted kinase
MIVVIFGLPGSGKTFFAKQLASGISGIHISSDAVRNSLKQKTKYNDVAKMEVYQLMLSLLEKGVAERKAVVLDATFYRKSIRNQFRKKAQQLNTPLYFIEMKADESVIKMRTGARRPDSEADFGVYLKIKKEFEPLEEDHLVLHSGIGHPETEMLSKALDYINYQDGTAAD